jgi:YhcH/YjgK/YiaL family protein
MILDLLPNASCYRGVHPSLVKGFAWLSSYDPTTPNGPHEIDGSALVAIVSRYKTAPASEKKWESHRVHGDIQYMVSGAELIGYEQRERLKIHTPYDGARDVEFYEAPNPPLSRFTLNEGSFAIFLPQDGHQPGVMMERPADVHKVVIKFRI